MLRSLLVSSALAGSALAGTAAGYLNYTTVTGYFLQDEASTNATTFDYVRPLNAGAIMETETSMIVIWKKAKRRNQLLTIS